MSHLHGETLLLRVDASSQMGTGHLMRCLALAQAWQDVGGNAIFITTCKNEGLLQRLRTEGFSIHLIANPYPDSDDWDRTEKILAAYPGAWVVIDGYHLDEVYQRQIRAAGHRLLVIDDMAHLKHYDADIVLNQNSNAGQLHYGCTPYTQLLMGTKYVLLRREFLAWSNWKREIPATAGKVLVTLGGSDHDNHTLKVTEAIQNLDVGGLEATVLVGASNPHLNTLKAVASQSPIPIRLLQDARNVPELMAEADVAISGGGTTTWEAAFMGLPSIVLVLADNQRLIAESLDKAGAAINLGWLKDITANDIRKSLQHLLESGELRSKIAERSRQLVDGHGVQRVINTMVNLTGGIDANCLSRQ